MVPEVKDAKALNDEEQPHSSTKDDVLPQEAPQISSEVGATTSSIFSTTKNSKNEKTRIESEKKKLPKMCLEECHKFHTNPAVSGPHNSCKRANKDSDKSADDSGNNAVDNDGTSANIDTPIDHEDGAQIAPMNSSLSSKTMKRKERLVQYKTLSPSRQNPHQTNGSMHTKPIKNKNSTGLACHNVWAPNSNFCKNAELLAIASPLSIHSLTGANNSSNNSNNQSGSVLGGNQSGVAHQNLNSGTGTQAPNHAVGSNVYILVFDEGTFAHCTEFNLSDEVCELFGLPTQRMVWRGTGTGHGISPTGESENAPIKTATCGLRRTVFQNPSLDNGDVTTGEGSNTATHGTHGNHTSDTGIGEHSADYGGEEEEIPQDTQQSSKTGKFSCKAKSFYKDVTTKIVKPFATHFVEEMKNCYEMLQYEVFDDGRIFGAARDTSGNITAAELPGDTHGSEDQFDEGRKKASPNIIRPQLVFHINLPYSSTSMEVTGLDWNTDGTTLTITQRRKGSTNSFAAVSTSLTNKKKKPSISAISPGSTAISFWSIPEWLHVSCEDLKMSLDGKELRYNDGDGIIIKANTSLDDTVGWEVALTDDNRSLFPLWEWYLANYIFHDNVKPIQEEKKKKRSRILIKNSMEYTAYPMELYTPSSCSSVAVVRSSKKTPRCIKGVAAPTDNANSIINGEITCLFWEESQICKDDKYFDDEETDDEKNDDKKSDNKAKSNLKPKDKNAHLIPASKWVAIGTSKGQMILHNNAASFVSYQNKKASKKSGGIENSKGSILNPSSILPQARTVVVPLRHKKRITCGAWVDNLLVFSHVSTGCLTVVSTCPKIFDEVDTTAISSDKIDAFTEKSTKVLGNILLPGGRDADDILIGNIEDDLGSVTILSVNCEGKSLLFYTFPKFLDSGNVTSQASNITSSPAMEVNFAMATILQTDDSILSSPQKKGNKSCGNIVFHYIVPNTLLVLVAFSSGYFALVDWVNGIILSDEDVLLRSRLHIWDDQLDDLPRDFHDNFLLDVTYHIDTSTLACVTQDGNAMVYHIRMLDGCHEVKAGDCTCSTGITISTKTHTRPKTKASSNLVECDSSVKRVMGTIDYLCAHSLPFIPSMQPDTRKLDLVSFSADGECISVSLGDESVIILSINAKDDECDRLKQKLAESVYLGTDGIVVAFFSIVCVAVTLACGNSPEFASLVQKYFANIMQHAS